MSCVLRNVSLRRAEEAKDRQKKRQTSARIARDRLMNIPSICFISRVLYAKQREKYLLLAAWK